MNGPIWVVVFCAMTLLFGGNRAWFVFLLFEELRAVANRVHPSSSSFNYCYRDDRFWLLVGGSSTTFGLIFIMFSFVRIMRLLSFVRFGYRLLLVNRSTPGRGEQDEPTFAKEVQEFALAHCRFAAGLFASPVFFEVRNSYSRPPRYGRLVFLFLGICSATGGRLHSLHSAYLITTFCGCDKRPNPHVYATLVQLRSRTTCLFPICTAFVRILCRKLAGCSITKLVPSSHHFAEPTPRSFGTVCVSNARLCVCNPMHFGSASS